MHHCKWKFVVYLTGYNIKKMGMVKAKVGDDSPRKRAPRDESDAPLSAEAEADLRRLALKWASLIQDAASFEQPMRALLEFVGSFLPKVKDA
jgi:hypothetical protein